MRYKPWQLHGIAHRLCPITPEARAAIAGDHFDVFSEQYQTLGITRAAHVRASFAAGEDAIRSMARDIDRTTNNKKG